ncbi:hypothetical protein IWQ56_001074 [Coemansia nantahalensis]|uniref:Uncharacterized protein n=1 Tax=Coemansia helicoidea TaxID=1286919 RepID=A0ACC1LG54_9FUNG|nr:hypothetical protein IWQ56_001074 [Coemansia nantahalensis]KAJ2807092.1 hypothetical protein H4R21_000615 [Coemansia helicoidea]
MAGVRRRFSACWNWLAGDQSDKPTKLVHKSRPVRLPPGPHVISAPVGEYHTWETLVALSKNYVAQMDAAEAKKRAVAEDAAAKAREWAAAQNAATNVRKRPAAENTAIKAKHRRVANRELLSSTDYLHAMFDLFPIAPMTSGPTTPSASPATTVARNSIIVVDQKYALPSWPATMPRQFWPGQSVVSF